MKDLSLKDIFKKKYKRLLVIAEKYSVASDYAIALDCRKRGDGCFYNDKYIIVWTDGHICTLYLPEDYDCKYKVWNMEQLPIIPNGFYLKIRQGKESRLKLIKLRLQSEDVTAVCVATDSAREGNLIGEYTLRVAENNKKVYRAMINTSNKEEIRKGFKNIRAADVYENMTSAAEARNEIDWLLGINLSRAYSLLYKKKMYIGRCSTVILSILCKKEKQILSTERKFYYIVSSSFKGDNIEYTGFLEEKIDSQIEAEKVRTAVKGKCGKISGMETSIIRVPPAQLFNLNDLLRAANRRFGYTSEDTYKIAQALYEEHKLITYARTDSRYIKKSDIDEAKMILNCIKNEKMECVGCDINNINTFIKRCVNDEKVIEHGAIRPLNKDNINEKVNKLSREEKNVYELIVENFLANFCEDYIYNSTSIETIVNGYKFKTHLKKVIQAGWKGVEESELNLSINKGNKVESIDVQVRKVLSQLPERYTDDTLMSVLENPGRFVESKKLKAILKENGIGTNATRALLLKELLDHEYIIREGKHIRPTVEGEELITKLKTDKLKEPFFTAEIEEKLQLIQAGNMNKDVLIKEIREFICDHINELKKEYIVKESKEKVIGRCPLCRNGAIVETANHKGYGCTNLKNTGCRFYISKEILGAKLDSNQIKKLITNGKTDSMVFVGKQGTFNARIKLEGGKTKFER